MSEIETFNEQELLQEARARGAQPLAGREAASRYGAAAALVVLAVGLWIAAPPAGVDVPLLAALIRRPGACLGASSSSSGRSTPRSLARGRPAVAPPPARFQLS